MRGTGLGRSWIDGWRGQCATRCPRVVDVHAERAVGASSHLRTADALAMMVSALHALQARQAELHAAVMAVLARELSPRLHESAPGLRYPTFTSLEALAAAVGASTRLAAVALDAHSAASTSPPPAPMLPGGIQAADIIVF